MERMHIVKLSSIVLLLLTPANSKLTSTSNDRVVLAGDSTFLNCTGPELIWRYYPPGHDGHDKDDEEIYFNGTLQPKYKQKRFGIDGNKTAGEVNLFIRNVTPDMAGKYECINGVNSKEYESVQLIVLEDIPSCQITPVLDDLTGQNTCKIPQDEFSGQNIPDLPQNGFIGPNTCGLPPEEITLSCSVTYFGNGTPVLELKEFGESNVLKSCSNEVRPKDADRQRVTCDITMKAELHLDGTQFFCQITQSAQKQCYSNITNPLKISYSINGDTSSYANKQLGVEVDCMAKCSQSCDYKWIWSEKISQIESQSREYATRVLNLTRTGSYRCEARCQIRNQLCKVTPVFVEVSSPPASERMYDTASDQLKITVTIVIVAVIIIIVLVAVAVTLFLLRRWRRINRDGSDTQTDENLLQDSHSTENGLKEVTTATAEQAM